MQARLGITNALIADGIATLTEERDANGKLVNAFIRVSRVESSFLLLQSFADSRLRCFFPFRSTGRRSLHKAEPVWASFSWIFRSGNASRTEKVQGLSTVRTLRPPSDLLTRLSR